MEIPPPTDAPAPSHDRKFNSGNTSFAPARTPPARVMDPDAIEFFHVSAYRPMIRLSFFFPRAVEVHTAVVKSELVKLSNIGSIKATVS